MLWDVSARVRIGRIRRVDLVIDRGHRQAGRQETLRGVDGSLHFLLGHVDTQAEHELQRNYRSASGTRRKHLVQTGYFTELPFKGRGNRGSRHVGAGARVRRDDLYRRVIHFGQGGYRQLPVNNNRRAKSRTSVEKWR
jgi:hypothetical protein